MRKILKKKLKYKDKIKYSKPQSALKPGGLYFPFVIGRGRGGKQLNTAPCGCCDMEQNCYAIAAFRRFFKTESNIKRVIELGTGQGGFSQFLNEQCIAKNIEFRTFEVDPKKCTACAKHGFVSEMILEDEKIGDIIRSSGKTVLLVDGGDKAEDIINFSQYLKPGDIIMGHDYASSFKFFLRNLRSKNIWRTWAWGIKSLKNTGLMDKYNLKEYRPSLFWRAAWGAFVVDKT